MKPDYLSYDEYGTVQLAQLLMYVNGVSSLEDFDLTRPSEARFRKGMTNQNEERKRR